MSEIPLKEYVSMWYEQHIPPVGGTSLPKPPSPSHVASGGTQKHPDPYPQKVVRLSPNPQGLIQTNLAPAVLRGACGCSWCAVLMPWKRIYLTCTLQLFGSSREAAAVECKSQMLCRIASFPQKDIQQSVSSNGSHFWRLFASLTRILSLTVMLTEL